MSLENENSLEEPISVIIPAGATQTISFPQQFFRRVTSVIISNLDGANNATYQINGTGSPILTLAAGAFRTLNGVEIHQLDITAAVAGAFQVQAVGVPFVR